MMIMAPMVSRPIVAGYLGCILPRVPAIIRAMVAGDVGVAFFQRVPAMVVRTGAAGLPAPAPRDAPRSELHFLGRGGGRLHVSTDHSSTAQRSGTTLSTGSSDAPLLRVQWNHPALLRPLLRRLYRRCHRLMLPDLPHLLAAGGMRRRAAGQGSGRGAASCGAGGFPK